MNVELLEKVKHHILEEPKRLYMGVWQVAKGEWKRIFYTEKKDGVIRQRSRQFAKCGFAACIAGWTCVISNNKVGSLYVYNTAKDLLGLTDEQAKDLFYPENWPRQFKDGLAENGTRKTAEAAAKRIDYFIKHGK